MLPPADGELDGATPLIRENGAVYYWMCFEGGRMTIAYYFNAATLVSLRQQHTLPRPSSEQRYYIHHGDGFRATRFGWPGVTVGLTAEGRLRCLIFNTKTRQPGLVSDRAFAFAG